MSDRESWHRRESSQPYVAYIFSIGTAWALTSAFHSEQNSGWLSTSAIVAAPGEEGLYACYIGGRRDTSSLALSRHNAALKAVEQSRAQQGHVPRPSVGKVRLEIPLGRHPEQIDAALRVASRQNLRRSTAGIAHGGHHCDRGAAAARNRTDAGVGSQLFVYCRDARRDVEILPHECNGCGVTELADNVLVRKDALKRFRL
jgi:hypothetical protein